MGNMYRSADTFLTNEENMFLQILRKHLHKSQVDLQENKVDWIALNEIALKHQMQAIVHYQCKSFTDKQFFPAYAAQISAYSNMYVLVREIDELLCNYKHIFFKGVKVSSFYPVPQLRSMGDIDMLIYPDDKEEICKLLQKSGYECFDQARNVWCYRKRGILFEVHHNLLHDESSTDSLNTFFSQVWDYVNDEGELDWNFHFLYLLVHLRHHLTGKGVGFRQFYDIAVLSEYCSLDWNWIQKKAKEISLEAFLQTVLKLNENWFGTTVPYDCNEIEESVFEQITYLVFKNGVFGFNNDDICQSELSRMVINTGNDISYSRAHYILRTIFPPYYQMVRKPYCSYLKKTAILLPVAWIHRWLKRSISKRSWNSLSHRLMVDKNAENRINLLKQLGL